MRKRNKDRPSRRFALPILLVLLVLGVIAVWIFCMEKDRIEQMEYPRKYSQYVEYYAGKYGIDPLLLYTFIRTESNFNAYADSDAGARGLMQITEVTFDWIKSNIAPTEDLSFDDLYDPETNIRFGSYFISYCLKQYDNDIGTAAAAYHSGLGTVNGLLKDSDYTENGRTLMDFPYKNMRQYVAKIESGYQNYCGIYSETVQ
jgi:soluble lytic murein transglycosylase